MAAMSSSSIFLYFSALMMMLKSVTANGVRAIWNTFVPRLAIFCSTYTFAPCTMVMTVMSVATPIVSPSIVSEARSLCARKALKHCTRLSRTASIGLEKTPTHSTDSFARAPPLRVRHGTGHYLNTKEGERELQSLDRFSAGGGFLGLFQD